MAQHAAYRFSVTIKTEDLAVLNCLRALSEFSQKSGNNRIPWGNTKDSDWSAAGDTATFHFSEPSFRDGFVFELSRLLPRDLWQEVRRSDTDPARPAQ